MPRSATPGPRSPVVTFVIPAAPVAVTSSSDVTASKPRLLHHWGFICALLNDLFGIQARGGCLCAGPYVAHLLGYSAAETQPEEIAELEAALLSQEEILRPGVVRVAFPYYMSHGAFRHTVRAVEWVASHASSLLPLYRPQADTGGWKIDAPSSVAAVAAGYADASASAAAMVTVPTSGGTGSIKLRPSDVISAATLTSGATLPTLTSAGQGRSLKDMAIGRVAVTAAAAAAASAAATSGGGGHKPPVWWPNHRIVVKIADDAEAEAALPACGSNGSSALRPLINESVLYRAYEEEAQLLLAGLSLRPELTADVATTSHNPAALLSPACQRLRWFALAADVSREGKAEPSAIDFVSRIQIWHLPATATATATAAASTDASDPWSVPPSELTSLLSTDVPSLQQLLAWDGEPPVAHTAASKCQASSPSGSGSIASSTSAITSMSSPSVPAKPTAQPAAAVAPRPSMWCGGWWASSA